MASVVKWKKNCRCRSASTVGAVRVGCTVKGAASIITVAYSPMPTCDHCGTPWRRLRSYETRAWWDRGVSRKPKRTPLGVKGSGLNTVYDLEVDDMKQPSPLSLLERRRRWQAAKMAKRRAARSSA